MATDASPDPPLDQSPDPSPDPPPDPASDPPSVEPIRRGRVAAGVAIALAGHVPATGLWLLTFYSFVYYASPDSPFVADCCVILLQASLFIGCVGPGLGRVRRGERGIGLGLLIGWAAGVVVLVVGSLAIAFSVLPGPG